MKVAVIGYGARGSYYADLVERFKGQAEIVAVCDLNQELLNVAKAKHGLTDDKLFLCEKEFFGQGKLADLLIVATQDADHIGHATAALGCEYDLLLEKPIANSWQDCKTVYDMAKAKNRRVFLCHVLRYASFFASIKAELDSGAYGKVATINLTESVGYWHYAHSYVRGNWRSSSFAAPMVVAKCSHDLDIISWLAEGNKALSVSSYGNLGYFVRENAPKNSAERCPECACKAECAYSAEKLYMPKSKLSRLKDTLFGDSLSEQMNWISWILCKNPTKEKVAEALKTSPYGRCVYKCDNDVVDRQIVNIDFENGVTGHLTMTAFGRDCYRKIHVHCEKGEIYGDMRENLLISNIFGVSKSKKIRTGGVKGIAGHGGGDQKMIKNIIDLYSNPESAAAERTSIENSMQSHAIGFAAEESRLDGGKVVALE